MQPLSFGVRLLLSGPEKPEKRQFISLQVFSTVIKDAQIKAAQTKF